jgi:hypothetical protein
MIEYLQTVGSKHALVKQYPRRNASRTVSIQRTSACGAGGLGRMRRTFRKFNDLSVSDVGLWIIGLSASRSSGKRSKPVGRLRPGVWARNAGSVCRMAAHSRRGSRAAPGMPPLVEMSDSHAVPDPPSAMIQQVLARTWCRRFQYVAGGHGLSCLHCGERQPAA